MLDLDIQIRGRTAEDIRAQLLALPAQLQSLAQQHHQETEDASLRVSLSGQDDAERLELRGWRPSEDGWSNAATGESARSYRSALILEFGDDDQGGPARDTHIHWLPGEQGNSGVYADDDGGPNTLRVFMDSQSDVYLSVHAPGTAPQSVRVVGHCARRVAVLTAARALARSLEQPGSGPRGTPKNTDRAAGKPHAV